MLLKLATTPHKYRSLCTLKTEDSHDEIMGITNNFERVIGKGGFGTEYHGFTKDGTWVAVKTLSLFSPRGPQEFRTEGCGFIFMRQRNEARFYIQTNSWTQVMTGRALDESPSQEFGHLGGDGESSALSWSDRIQIAIDVAHG